MYENALNLIKSLQEEIDELPGVKIYKKNNIEYDQYSLAITDQGLKKATEKLFRDGHHARAIEEAYKYIDNLVKKTAKPMDPKLSGSSLMQKVFSENDPILKLNAGTTQSECDEQKGYMQIFAGCMTGIRNPRAHECDWEDSEEHAFQLLTFACHLVDKICSSEKASNKP